MDRFTLNKLPLQKWYHNLIIFLAPVLLLYLGTVTAVVIQPNHIFSLNDFVPSQIAIGGMVLWVLNTAQDYLRKLKAQ